VKLKRAGREFKGLSPFNQEKTPSFTVNDQKGFLSRLLLRQARRHFRLRHGDRGASPFPEAVERLAGMAGLPMPKVSREDEVREARRKTLHDVVEIAAKFFEATLAARARAPRRAAISPIAGSMAATQLKFRIGYAPADRFALKEHLGKEGIPVEDMIEAGLVISGDEIPGAV
jgi:DNA primase